MSEIKHRDRLPGDIVREIGANLWIHHPGQPSTPTNLSERRRQAEMTVGERYQLQREQRRASDPWLDPTRVITRRPDMTILVDGRPIGGR